MPGIGRFEETDIWEQTVSDRGNGYDGFLYSEQIESALEDEAEDRLNAQLYRDEQNYLNESPKKKQLKRELQREALERFESLAKTEEQFKEVLKQWDRLQENSDRRFRDHVSVRGDVPLEYGMAKYGCKFPFYLNTVYWESLLAGRYLDVLFDCPFEIDDVTSVESVSVVLRGLKNEYKELLNYLIIRGYSTEQVGENVQPNRQKRQEESPAFAGPDKKGHLPVHSLEIGQRRTHEWLGISLCEKIRERSVGIF